MPFPGGLWWLLCCRQGFTLLRRDYGEAEREADGEAEEEASFELRAQGDRVGPSGTGRHRSRRSVRFGSSRGRPAPRRFALRPSRSRSAVRRGPQPDPPLGAGGVRSPARCCRCRERIRRFPSLSARPAPCRRLSGHVLPWLGVRRAGLPLARPLCGAPRSEPPGGGSGSSGRGGSAGSGRFS